MAPSPQERPFFVIGQGCGADIQVWAAQEAPRDEDEQSGLREEYRLEAEEAFGSVEVVAATNSGKAKVKARIRRTLASPDRKTEPRNRRSGVGSHHRDTHYYW
ncbi:hypothetical protein AB0E81_34705 [Streptomyces sp. NPDC033538]|uniref:hypothetical protein n=1 Tax=Streptomyces sp. NPDC033538 TaxID=3155367 RepID=UPI0033E7B1F9